MEKIKMTTPLVEMDGDEMTRILWKMIKDELLLPFIDLPLENVQKETDIIGFMEQIIYASKPQQENDMEYVSRYVYFVKSLTKFDANKIEKYIQNEDRSVVNTIKRRNVGQSGYITDKPADYYNHYSNKEDEATGLLEDEATGLLVEDEATGLLMEEQQTVHYASLYRLLTNEVISINKPVFRIGKEIKNTNITIEEYNDEMSAYSVQPKIDLYLSSDFLDCYSNEELYFFMKSIVSDTNPRFLRVTFILLDDEKNSRIDLKELAIILGVDEASVVNELQKMEEEHIICGYHTLIDWDKAGIEKVTALIEVRVTPQRGMGFDKVAERIYNYPEVNSVYLISGGFDFMVTIEGKTLREVSQFVSDKLSPLDSVLSTKTNFILKKYKDHGTVMAEQAKDERIEM